MTLVASNHIELDDLPPPRLRPLRRGAGNLDRGQRVAARVGQPLRAADFRALRPKQARGRALSGHQLSHAGGVLGYGYTEAPAAGSRTPGWARLPGVNHARPATLVQEAAVQEAAHVRHEDKSLDPPLDGAGPRAVGVNRCASA